MMPENNFTPFQALMADYQGTKKQANKYLICWPVFHFAQNGLIF